MQKKQLNFWQILTMNFGFFGVQFSFGLQQSNMSAIYKYLGAEEAELPLLWLAGPSNRVNCSANYWCNK